jgi:hypothetical protein
MTRRFLVVALCLLAAPLAQARQVDGDLVLAKLPAGHPLHALHLRPLRDDMVRFTGQAAFSGWTTVVELARFDDKLARGHAWFLQRTRQQGFIKAGEIPLTLPIADFVALQRDLVSDAKADLAVNEQAQICTDGPRLLTEYRVDGASHWIEGFCGTRANNHVAETMARVIEANMSAYLRSFGGQFNHPFAQQGLGQE